MYARLVPVLTLACILVLGCAPRSETAAAAIAAAPAAASAVAPLPAHGLPRAAPEEVGLSAEALARIGPAMQAYVDSGRVGGVLVTVARQGKLAYLETFGRADLERDVPLAPDAVFRIYSMTKPVTAVAVMQLVEQGKLRLDDPVSKYISAFADVRVYAGGGAANPSMVPAERPITIQDLLAHTSGLPYGLFGSPTDSIARTFDLFRASRTVEGFADSVARLPLAFQPGSRWGYGPGLEVLGRVIEIVSGGPFDRYLDEEIFGPLGMRSTSFRLRPELRTRLAVMYVPGEDRRLQPVRDFLGAAGYEPGARFVWGGGGLVSTAADYLRFAQMLLDNGELNGVRVLRPETVALMRQNMLPPEQIPLPRFTMQAPGFGHGLGVGVQVAPATEENPTAQGTFGWAGAGNTFFWIDPANELIGMVWAQHYFASTQPLLSDVKRLVYAALASGTPAHAPAGSEPALPAADAVSHQHVHTIAPTALPRIRANDNRHAAGVLRRGVLSLRLVAQDGLFLPDGEDGRSMPLQAFGEEGKRPSSPAPLIRVPAGTEIHVTIRNALTRPLVVRGLSERETAAEPVEVMPGAVRDLRFRATEPGTYVYWGRTTTAHPEGMPGGEDSQLVGAFIVDPAGGARARDRVLVMTTWFSPAEERKLEGLPFEVMAINGRSWPFTERLSYTVGDSIRWRVVNGTHSGHPMHLHGFYYRVDSRGDGVRDTVYTAEQRRMAVTEMMRPGSTMLMTWSPSSHGNWLFHCHLAAHMAAEHRLTPPKASHRHAMNHAADGMAGLVTGIHVRPRRGERRTEAAPPPAKRLRLYVNAREGVFDGRAGYGFVLQEGPTPPAPDSIRLPGTPLHLVRGELTEITVINRTPLHIAVHWHGIELQSYYDGVGDWSGAGKRTAPSIAAGDSFVVRVTPVRAGTFIYHTHADEGQQLGSGLYGPLLVHEPGRTPDTTGDHVFLLSLGGPERDAPPWVNGSADPPPVELETGRTYRFRLINITPNGREDVVLRADSTVQQWRAIAKDGADLPAWQATLRPARVHLSAGETWDFEVTPDQSGEWVLESTVRSLGIPPKTVLQRFLIRPRD